MISYNYIVHYLTRIAPQIILTMPQHPGAGLRTLTCTGGGEPWCTGSGALVVMNSTQEPRSANPLAATVTASKAHCWRECNDGKHFHNLRVDGWRQKWTIRGDSWRKLVPMSGLGQHYKLRNTLQMIVEKKTGFYAGPTLKIKCVSSTLCF